MSIFKNMKKPEPYKPSVSSSKEAKPSNNLNSTSLADKNKLNSINILTKEKEMLKVTLDYMIKENAQLKNQIEDMKLTVQHNKLQLKEYIDNITNKDKVVEKMNSTIELLQSRLNMYETYHKSKNSTDVQSSTKNLNSSFLGTITDNFNDPYGTNVQLSSTKVGGEHSLINVVNSTSQMENSLNMAYKINCDSKKNINFYHKKNKSSNINCSYLQTNTGVSEQENGVNASKLDAFQKSLFKGQFLDNQICSIKASNSTNISPNNSFVFIKPTSDSKFGVPVKKHGNDYKVINNNWNFNQTINSDAVKVKEAMSNQQKILEEILNIKNDLQFLMESAVISKSKIREKLNLSIATCIDETRKRDKQNFNSNCNQTRIDQLNQTSCNNNSFINQSVTCGLNSKSYNFEERFSSKRSLAKLQEFLEDFDLNKNLLLLVDSQGTCWELVKRPDITPNQIKDGENIISILNKEYEHFLFTDKLLNIEMKDHEDEFHNSAIDISRVNDSILN